MHQPSTLPLYESAAAPGDMTADPGAEAAAPLIIVGNGPVGVRFAQELLLRGFSQPVLMFGAEPWAPYNRIQLSALLAGDIRLDGIANPVRRADDARLVEHLHCAVTAIDPIQHRVLDAAGRWHRYAQLVLAVGSRAHVPAIEGVDKDGVFTFRNLRDTETLLARTARSRHTVVAGGGLLGLEAARALQRGRTRVTVVQQGQHLLNRQLDERGAALLRRYVEQLGIEVRTGAGLGAVLGDTRVSGVALRDGSRIDCDTVLFATGIKPNIELARQSWIKVNTGIVVDDGLQTSTADIYAIGECAEHNGNTYGLIAPGYEQAAALADRLCGGGARYAGSIAAAQLKVVGQPVFSAGEAVDLVWRPRQREYRWQDREGGRYRKLVLQRGQLIGAVAVGECDQSRRLQEAVQNRRRLRWWELLRFRYRGDCWPAASAEQVALWPAATLVCQCMGVNRGRLSECIERGCASAAQLTQQTGAGSVCGSCRPLLQNLLGSGRAEPARDATPLWMAGTAAALLILLWCAIPAQQVADTVQGGWRFEQLWNDGLMKQISGFTLLGAGLLGLILSLRKRVRRFKWGAYTGWRVLHLMLGLVCAAVLMVHTGFHGGGNFNRLLLVDFIAVMALGAVAGVTVGIEHQLQPAQARVLRSTLLWGHILAVWPLPVLLLFHVLTVYYF